MNTTTTAPKFKKIDVPEGTRFEQLVDHKTHWDVAARYEVRVDGELVGIVDKVSRMWFRLSAPLGIVNETGWCSLDDDGLHSLISTTRKSATRSLTR